ncbi:hypothetical protein J4480_05265 [Candidatus Woesearchaeota archaeon]|nr:hypothetical protein [Candidatus Woesearchaeota archaeon]
MALEFLRKIGLSDGEIKVYSSLLDLGKAPLNKIHERTGIERRNIYDILNKLIERGLVTYIKENKKRLFEISHPNKIIGYVEEKKHELDITKQEIEKELPSILEKYNFKKPDINAEIFRGIEGVKAVWEDMLNHKEIYWIGSGRYVPKRLSIWFSNYNRRRVKQKVKWLNLMRNEMKKEIKKPLEFEKIKFLPKEFSGNPTAIGIYGNKIVNFLLGEDFFAFMIENKEIADDYRKYHSFLWNIAKNQ